MGWCLCGHLLQTRRSGLQSAELLVLKESPSFFSLIFLKNLLIDGNHAFEVDEDIDDEVGSECDKDDSNDAVHPYHDFLIE